MRPDGEIFHFLADRVYGDQWRYDAQQCCNYSQRDHYNNHYINLSIDLFMWYSHSMMNADGVHLKIGQLNTSQHTLFTKSWYALATITFIENFYSFNALSNIISNYIYSFLIKMKYRTFSSKKYWYTVSIVL